MNYLYLKLTHIQHNACIEIFPQKETKLLVNKFLASGLPGLCHSIEKYVTLSLFHFTSGRSILKSKIFLTHRKISRQHLPLDK